MLCLGHNVDSGDLVDLTTASDKLSEEDNVSHAHTRTQTNRNYKAVLQSLLHFSNTLLLPLQRRSLILFVLVRTASSFGKKCNGILAVIHAVILLFVMF